MTDQPETENPQQQQLDEATIRACVAMLNNYMVPPHLNPPNISTRATLWTFSTNPVDLLLGMIPPPPPREKTAAEKLADEWVETQGLRPEAASDIAAAFQFALDRVGRQAAEQRLREMASSSTEAVSEATSEPRYIFGPWRSHTGEECPVPGEWECEVRLRSGVNPHDSWPASDWVWGECSSRTITEYRVRFEVGKWYDWEPTWYGAECPLHDDVRVDVELVRRDTDYNTAGYFAGIEDGSSDWWILPFDRRWQITRFCICPDQGEAQ